jgi:ubiquinol-cytochrome c reductase iron-sulfur subunit
MRAGLTRLTKLLILLGLAFVAVPFVSYMLGGSGTASDELARRQQVVDVSDLSPAGVRELSWRGWPVWVYRRTPADLAALHRLGPELSDAASTQSEQPAEARSPERSLVPEYFVFIPRETVRNCQVRLLEPGELKDTGAAGAVFTEPCYRARFDAAGRLYRGTGDERQRNLRVPPHRVLSGERIALEP